MRKYNVKYMPPSWRSPKHTLNSSTPAALSPCGTRPGVLLVVPPTTHTEKRCWNALSGEAIMTVRRKDRQKTGAFLRNIIEIRCFLPAPLPGTNGPTNSTLCLTTTFILEQQAGIQTTTNRVKAVMERVVTEKIPQAQTRLPICFP